MVYLYVAHIVLELLTGIVMGSYAGISEQQLLLMLKMMQFLLLLIIYVCFLPASREYFHYYDYHHFQLVLFHFRMLINAIRDITGGPLTPYPTISWEVV